MDDESGTGLPASIEAAWGLRTRPAKGPKPGLSLERIVEAGVKVAVSEGLGAVSMSRVAAELGASTMSLYRYVAAKDELLALMMDAALGPPPDDIVPDGGWRAGLSRWAWAERALLRQHTWVLHVPLTAPPATPNQIAWLERALRCMRGTGLTEGEKISVVILITSFVWRESTIFADLTESYRKAGSPMQDPTAGYGRMLAKLIDSQQFPALTDVINSGVFDQPDDPDTEFAFGLERIQDGVESLIRSRT